ncbi:cell wall-binding repeat-containing protein [Rossellomorea marisflavi]|uniref:cell wall-binding repeat-containing protein n=1 Tax=Rossellomorea marisflavi TaxID=189381 RepID=UPI00351984A2
MKRLFGIIGVLAVFLFSSLAGGTVASAAGTTIQNAQEIGVNTDYKGTLKDYDDEHFYKFKLSEAGKVSLQVNRKAGTSWDMAIIDKDGNEYTGGNTKSDNTASGKEIREVGLPAGDFYVYIGDWSNAVGVQYQFNVNFEKGAYFEKEFNDTLSTANEVKLNQEYQGFSENYEDEDFYKFTLASPGNVVLDVNRKAGVSWYVDVIDSEGYTYSSFSTESGTSVTGKEQVHIGLPKGTFYIVIESSSWGIQPYKFKVNYTKSEYYEKEFNDTANTANDVSLNKQYKGAIQSYDDLDYFKFKLNKKSKIAISMKRNASTSWSVVINDSKGNEELYFSTETGSNAKGSEIKYVELPAGTYHMLIEGSSSSINIPYTFKIQERTKRIAGPTRYETAVEISKEGWSTSGTVVLAKGNDFPDALAGGPLAHYYKAPILLTNGKKLTAVSKKEIQRLKAKKVVLLGGEGAISNGVASELKKMGVTVERVGGKNRYETAAAIAKKIPSTKVVVANGKSFADALAVAPYASKNQMPILLTDPKYLPAPTKNAIKGKQSTIVVGGNGAVSDTVMSKLPAPKRYGGATRYDTAKIIVQQLPLGKGIGYVATGKSFPDALAGSSLAAKNNAPLLLVDPKYIPSQTKSVMTGFTKYGVWGGPSAVSEKTVNDLDAKVTPIK